MLKRGTPDLGGRHPLLYAALAFAAGIVMGVYAWRPPTWWLGAVAIFGASALYLLRSRTMISRVIAILVWIVLGAVSIQLRPGTPVPAIDRFLDGNEVALVAHVVHDGRMREGGFGGVQQSLDLETESVTNESGTCRVPFGIRLTLYAKAAANDGRLSMPTYRYGTRVHLRAKLHWPHNYRNPGAFDYAAYLAEQGIVAQGSGRAESVEVLPGFAGSVFESWRASIRRNILEKVHELWNSKQAALIDAMVIGEDAFLRRDTRVDFQRSGTYHILVVSGINVGILAFVLLWILRRLRVSEVVAGAMVVLLSVAYASLTDVGPPIWRATLMFALYLGVRMLYRERSMLNALGGAALGLMIFDPKALLGASFQLTFLAVLIIAAIGIPLLERTSEPYRKGLRELDSADYDAYLPPKVAQMRLDIRLVNARVSRFPGKRIPLALPAGTLRLLLSVYDTLVISALMQVGLALPMAWYFHRATVMGLAANLFVIPLTGLLMPTAVAAVALSYVSTWIARIPAFVAGKALDWITSAVTWVGTVRFADLRVPQPGPVIFLASCAALVTAMALARRKWWLSAFGLAALTCSAVWMAVAVPKPRIRLGVLEMTAIDVGQADSSLIVTPDGRAVLIDAGGPLAGIRTEFDTGEDVVSPYLWARRISRLDAVVITHAHSDHMGGMAAILNNFRPRELWIGTNPPSRSFTALLDQARQLGVRIVQLRADDSIQFGAVKVEVLWPPRDWTGSAEGRNEDSLALRFNYADATVFMEGDLDQKIERTFARQVGFANLLKVGHNGSLTSTSAELLAALHPRWAVISVGARNSFHHPRREILERLERSHVKAYRTDMAGAVSLYLEGSPNSLAALRR